MPEKRTPFHDNVARGRPRTATLGAALVANESATSAPVLEFAELLRGPGGRYEDVRLALRARRFQDLELAVQGIARDIELLDRSLVRHFTMPGSAPAKPQAWMTGSAVMRSPPFSFKAGTALAFTGVMVIACTLFAPDLQGVLFGFGAFSTFGLYIGLAMLRRHHDSQQEP